MNLIKKLKKIVEYKKPLIKEKTFLIWEPCSANHAEIVPGYAKYLLELGYHVSVLVTPQRYDEGLFSRFEEANITFNKMTQREIKKFFKKDSLELVSGVLVTTLGKLCNYEKGFDSLYKKFNKKTDKNKIFFVEHEVNHLVDNNCWHDNTITLRRMNYKNAKSIVVNPHYFGCVSFPPKNKKTVFITVGAISDKRKSTQVLVSAVKELVKNGVTNFKVVVVGKGKVNDLPVEIRPYIDIKGRLDFRDMYDEIEKSDFILSVYENIDAHVQYNTSKTSGSFQLVYGFNKPVIIKESFSYINDFNCSNSILYDGDNDYAQALISGINMTDREYSSLKDNLRLYTESLYETSKNNLMLLLNRNENVK